MIANAYVNRFLVLHLFTTTAVVVVRATTLWPLQLTAADAHIELGPWTILSHPVFSSRDFKVYTFRNHIRSYCTINLFNSAQRRATMLRKAEIAVDPPRFLVALRGELLRPTLSCHLHTPVCAVVRGGYGTGTALPAVGLRQRWGVDPPGFTSSSPCALRAHHGKVWGPPTN